jgi:hypothetical protein
MSRKTQQPPPTHRADPQPSTGPPGRPNWTRCEFGRRRIPARGRDRSGPPAAADGGGRPGDAGGRRTRGVPLIDTFEGRLQLFASYHMWHTGRPAADQCQGCTFNTGHVLELSYLHSRDVTFAMFCEGPFEESNRYRAFVGWEMP